MKTLDTQVLRPSQIIQFSSKKSDCHFCISGRKGCLHTYFETDIVFRQEKHANVEGLFF
jgi:hypothetical protein